MPLASGSVGRGATTSLPGAVPNATLAERQQAIEELVDYARAKPMVRVRSNKEILEWVRNPEPL